MIANLIGGFVAILIGVSLIGPVSTTINDGCNTSTNLSSLAPWGGTVCRLAPGFFALGIMGIGVAITYSSLRQAGIV